TTSLANNDAITVVMTSTATCATGSPATSNSITTTVQTTVTPTVSVSLTSGSNPGCSGSGWTFTASPTNGGNSPAYQWKLNGNNVGTNSSTYTNSSLTNGDIVSCVLTSNASCATTSTATSNNIVMSVTATVTYYQDSDGDGFGNSAVSTIGCSAPQGYVTNNTDCNDNNNAINPGANEVCTNTIDDNCDGQTNENCCTLTLSATSNSASCTAANDGSINLTVSGGTAYTYQWSNGATTEDISGLTPGTYSVTVTSGNCTENGNYTVGNSNNPAPAAPTAISGPAGVCRNSTGQVFTVTPVAGATSYAWTLPTGASGTSTTNSITLSFSSTYNTGNLCVRAVNICGQSSSFCRSVVAYITNPTTPGTISGPSTNVCAGTTQTYSIASVTNATTYQWTAPANASIVSGQGTTTVVVSFSTTYASSGTLAVKSVNCFGSSSNRTLVVYSIPGTPSVISGTMNNVCPGSTFTYSISGVMGATGYNWTAPANTTITAGQGTNSITLSIGNSFTTGTLSVVATSSCGQSATRTASLSKNPPALSLISGQTSNLCGGGQFTYSVSAVTGATSYNWIVPSGCSVIANNGNSITLSIFSTFISGTLSVTATNACGGSTSRSTTLTRLPATPLSISGPTAACPNQIGLTFTTPVVTGVTPTWTVPSGVTITSGQGTPSMTCNWSNITGSVSVRNDNACGQSAALSRTVTVSACMELYDEEEMQQEAVFTAYPNPSRGPVIITSNGFIRGKVYNSLGQEVQTFQLNESNGFSTTLSELPAGMYFLYDIDSNEPPIRLIQLR
ncbi:MAG: T9SS type A sorting domain-containing protein, partial [Flavobacteriales bacterium]